MSVFFVVLLKRSSCNFITGLLDKVNKSAIEDGFKLSKDKTDAFPSTQKKKKNAPKDFETWLPNSTSHGIQIFGNIW